MVSLLPVTLVPSIDDNYLIHRGSLKGSHYIWVVIMFIQKK